MDNGEMDLDYLSDFYKPLAMVFKPFSTVHTTFSNLNDLLTAHNITSIKRVEYNIPNHGHSPLDAIDVYLGNLNKIELHNFAGFVYYNQLEPVNTAKMRSYPYDVIIAVGRNRLTSVVVDIPIHMFPWTSAFFSLKDNADVLYRAPPLDIPSTHRMVRNCQRCTKNNRKCMKMDMNLSCLQCVPGDCSPDPDENIARVEQYYAEIMNTSYGLSAAYQYLLHTVKKAANCSRKPLLSNRDRVTLLTMVRADYNGIANWDAESAILAHCKSAQSVLFRNGKLEIVKERGMESIYGFECIDGLGHASATPHLGFPSSISVRNLLDTAISMVGTMVYTEECIWMRDGQFKPSRVFCVAGMMMHCDVSFVMGWNY